MANDLELSPTELEDDFDCMECGGEGCEWCEGEPDDDFEDDFPMSLEYDDDSFYDYDISRMDDMD